MFSLSNKLLTRKWGKCCFCMYGPQTKCSYACAHKGTCKRGRCLTVKETEVQRICHSFLKTTEPENGSAEIQTKLCSFLRAMGNSKKGPVCLLISFLSIPPHSSFFPFKEKGQ